MRVCSRSNPLLLTRLTTEAKPMLQLKWESHWEASLALFLFLRQRGQEGAHRLLTQIVQSLPSGPVAAVSAGENPLEVWKAFNLCRQDWESRIPPPLLTALSAELNQRRQVCRDAWDARGPGWAKAVESGFASFEGWGTAALEVEVVVPLAQGWPARPPSPVCGLVPGFLYDPEPGLPEWLRTGCWALRHTLLREGAPPDTVDAIACRETLRAAGEVGAVPDLDDLESLARDRWSLGISG